MHAYKIRTERLTLKKINESDAHYILQYRSAPSVYRYQHWKPRDINDVLGFIRTYSSSHNSKIGKWNQFGIFLNCSGRIIGDCGFRIFEPRQAEIGYTVDPAYQKKGYATEAMRGLIRFLYQSINVHRIIARTEPMNIASQKVATKLGFRQEGHFRKSIRIGNVWKDDLLFALLAEDWTHQNT